MAHECINCGEGFVRVLYMGLPLRLCRNEDCNTVEGFWSFLLFWEILPFNGVFVGYNDPYPVAVFRWLFGTGVDPHDHPRRLEKPRKLG